MLLGDHRLASAADQRWKPAFGNLRGDLVHVALLHRSRLSVTVVLQIIGVPRVVTPRALASEQNAPGCTTSWPPPLLGVDAGEVAGAGRVGWEGAGVAR